MGKKLVSIIEDNMKAINLNIKKGEIIQYCDSGMFNNNFVGYGGVIF